MSDARTSGASVSAPAPVTGPVSDAEMERVDKWWMEGEEYHDKDLAESLRQCDLRFGLRASYVIVRALRVGVKFEDLL